LKEFHTANILNAGGALFFSGDISTEQVNALLHVWESYPRKDFEWKLPEEGLPEGILFEDEITHLVPNTSQLSMRWAKHIGALDENKIHEFTLLNMVFGGYFGSRLMQELRERQGLTYGIHSYFEPLWKGRTWYLSGEMNSDNESKAMQGIKEIMYQLQNERIPQEELERAKKYYSGLFRSGFDGPFSQATKSSQILVRKYSDTFFSNTLETIWNVDSEQLLQLAQNELDPKTFVRVIAGDTN
jgi:predicted Zn-dependent peptidase